MNKKRGCGAFPYTVGFYSVVKNDVMAFEGIEKLDPHLSLFIKVIFTKGTLGEKKKTKTKLVTRTVRGKHN